jgi:hypothetical protein
MPALRKATEEAHSVQVVIGETPYARGWLIVNRTTYGIEAKLSVPLRDTSALRWGKKLRKLEGVREQRRSRRILASIPLEIQSSGEAQSALTAVINVNGALILSPVNLPAGSDISIRNSETGVETHGRVVWCGSQEGTGCYKLGVEFREAFAEFWGAHYNAYAEEAP